MNPLAFLLPLLLALKPNMAKVNRAKLKEHVRGLVDVALRSNDATWDDQFEQQIGDVCDQAIDQIFGPQIEPIPMMASPAADEVYEIAKKKGVSPAIIALILQFGVPFKILKRWFPDLAV